MEQDNLTQTEGQVLQNNVVNRVTPLSKYLAMVLFILLPFVGGWIGYQYAPEKVVEIEKVVIQEKITEVEKSDDEERFQLNQIGSATIGGREYATYTDGLQNGNTMSFDSKNFYFNGEVLYSSASGLFAFYPDEAGDIYQGWLQIDGAIYALVMAEPGTYQLTYPLDNIDPNSLSVLGYGYLTDGNNVYYLGSRLPTNLSQFTLEIYYPDIRVFALGLDSQNVYHLGKALDGLSPGQLEVDGFEYKNAWISHLSDSDTIYFARYFCQPHGGKVQFELGSFEELEEGKYVEECQWLKDRRAASENASQQQNEDSSAVLQEEGGTELRLMNSGGQQINTVNNSVLTYLGDEKRVGWFFTYKVSPSGSHILIDGSDECGGCEVRNEAVLTWKDGTPVIIPLPNIGSGFEWIDDDTYTYKEVVEDPKLCEGVNDRVCFPYSYSEPKTGTVSTYKGELLTSWDGNSFE
jgi:hypothetical protein